MEKKTILSADYLPNDEHSVKLDTTEDTNPRLKLNLPANKMFLEITNTNPPLLVVVCRADLEVYSLGLLEKAKLTVQIHHSKHDAKSDLSRGVVQAGKILSGGMH